MVSISSVGRVHHRLADGAAFVWQQALPGAQALQGGNAGVGEGDFAPVGGRVGQLCFGLLLQHRSVQARLGQGQGQRQTRWACTHNQNIGMHGHRKEGGGGRALSALL